MILSRPAIAAVVVALTSPTAAAAQTPRSAWPAVDSIFARYAGPGSPGCALSIASHDTVIYAHGYGRAVIEWGVPIDPGTVFELASMSKQFTAFTILTLERDGKLALDDDVRRWIPELPRYGKPITLSHLLHHTSGIRDYDPLLVYRGTRYHDVATNGDVLDMLSRQKGLNFPTGTRWQYSNSNYVLLAIVAERVTGQALRDVLRQRIFEPLGMTNSRLRVDHTEVIPHRAKAYQRATDSTYSVDDSNWEETGDGTIQSTVEDLAKWADNYRTGMAGGRQIVEKMVQVGHLDDGTPLTYAFGLIVDRWRGVDRVSHSGSWAGFRTHLVHFPESSLNVITLCNYGSADASGLALDVAARVLGDRLAPVPAPETVGRRGTALGDLAGIYWSNEEARSLRFLVKDATLMANAGGDATFPLVEVGAGQFTTAGGEWRLTFGGAGNRRTLSIHAGGGATEYRQVPPADTSAAALRRLAGRYRSEELKGAVWTIAIKDRGLTVQSAAAVQASPLTPQAADAWSGIMFDDPVTIRFVRGPGGAVTGFTANGFALWGLGFVRER